MNAALQALRGQLRFDLGRAIGAVGPHRPAGVVGVQNIVELLAVVHARIRHLPRANELVRLVMPTWFL